MHSIINKIYAALPVTIQNWGISLFGYSWHKKRFGGIFKQEVEKALKREFYTEEEWVEYQTQRLRKLLVHAFTHVPFYSQKYTDAGWSKQDLENFQLKDLNKLPFLEKDELRKFGTTSLLSTKKSKGTFVSSSGSSGTPVKVFLPLYFHQMWNALMEARVRKWASVNGQTPRGMIGGRRVIPSSKVKYPLYRYNSVEKQTYFSAYHLGPETIHNYVEGLRMNKVGYLTGYAMSIYTMARLIEENKLSAPQLKAVITSSEKMTTEMRSLIGRVFQCKVYDSYSGCEACGLISESPEGQLLFSPDSGILEVLDADLENVNPGGEGEVVLTGLHNLDQPLIRYRIGDRVKLSTHKANSHCMPVIDEIIGRLEDVVKGPDGREMVRFHALFTDLEGLKSAQVIQKKLDLIRINLVVTEFAAKDYIESKIKSRLQSQLGEVKVDFAYLNKLPLTKNGKVKAVISELND